MLCARVLASAQFFRVLPLVGGSREAACLVGQIALVFDSEFWSESAQALNGLETLSAEDFKSEISDLRLLNASK